MLEFRTQRLKGLRQTEADATVLEEVAQVVKHRTLILTTDATEVAEKPATVCHHSRKSDLLLEKKAKKQMYSQEVDILGLSTHIWVITFNF